MIGALLLTLAAAAAPVPGCAAVRAALPQAGVCVEQPGGIALAPDDATARTMLDQARAGETRFTAAFGRAPTRYAVFEFDDPATIAATIRTLTALGFVDALPIPSPARTERMTTEAVNQAIPGGIPGAPPRIVRRGSEPGTGEPRRTNTVPHELAHHWYTRAFWPAAAPMPAGTRRYGSPAPDWLDEAAAMLAEDEEGTRSYYRQIADGRGSDAQRAARIPPELPLATLTGMAHPSLADMPPPGTASAPVMIRLVSKPSLFYPETRVFADYLMKRSGDPLILAAISQGLSGGATFDAWLASDGAKHRLPVSLAAMQTDWDGWMDRRFGRAPDTP